VVTNQSEENKTGNFPIPNLKIPKVMLKILKKICKFKDEQKQ
jgi:hypothetical protein